MKRVALILLVALIAPAFAGTMYEWRDPATGRLKLGDRPPGNGVEYWIEGQSRPESIAEKKKREAELKAVQEQRDAVKAEKEKREAELKAAQEQQDAAKKAESEKEFHKRLTEVERKKQELENRRDQECPGRAFDIKIGMSKQLFELCMAMEPDHINTTETAGGVREQWVYPTLPGSPIIGKYYYFTNGILTAIQRQ